MKRALLAGIAAVALAAAQPADAADLRRAPVVKAPVVAAAPLYNWTGCYAGAHAGGLWGEVDHRATAFTPEFSRDVSFSNVTVGGHLGCNYQVNRFVVGIEGDLNWADVSGRDLIRGGGGIEQFFGHRFDWYGTVRGRLGYAVDRWHIYGTAGAAFSDIKMTYDLFAFDSLVSRDRGASKTGWVAGGGVEYALSPNWIGRLEYLYHRFGEEVIFEQGSQTIRGRPDFHVVRVGIGYKFATGKAPAPVVTRY